MFSPRETQGEHLRPDGDVFSGCAATWKFLTMNTPVDRPSAKIFVLTPRSARAPAQRMHDQAHGPFAVVPTEFGSGWYHEEAVRAAEKARPR